MDIKQNIKIDQLANINEDFLANIAYFWQIMSKAFVVRGIFHVLCTGDVIVLVIYSRPLVVKIVFYWCTRCCELNKKFFARPEGHSYVRN